jgi:hypothetical protein
MAPPGLFPFRVSLALLASISLGLLAAASESKSDGIALLGAGAITSSLAVLGARAGATSVLAGTAPPGLFPFLVSLALLASISLLLIAAAASKTKSDEIAALGAGAIASSLAMLGARAGATSVLAGTAPHEPFPFRVSLALLASISLLLLLAAASKTKSDGIAALGAGAIASVLSLAAVLGAMPTVATNVLGSLAPAELRSSPPTARRRARMRSNFYCVSLSAAFLLSSLDAVSGGLMKSNTDYVACLNTGCDTLCAHDFARGPGLYARVVTPPISA